MEIKLKMVLMISYGDNMNGFWEENSIILGIIFF